MLFPKINVEIYACDEEQTNTYIAQLLLGSSASSKSSNTNLKILENALYLCSEQADKNGEKNLNYLIKNKASSISSLDDINIKNSYLDECSHKKWNYESSKVKEQQTNRKKILKSAVNKVFDFGLFSNVFNTEKSESMSALLYYFHILSDYLADDPSSTNVIAGNKEIPSYSGKATVEINGGIPSFTSEQKTNTEAEIYYTGLDEYNRAGAVYGVTGKDKTDLVEARADINKINPTGWNQHNYSSLIKTSQVYNRCHLFAHVLGGADKVVNLITGTRYLNESMLVKETEVMNYIKTTENHVYYRATPFYQGENKVASGVQLEAYSIEDNGKGICFNVYCYNVQPGVSIDYETGSNKQVDKLFQNRKAIQFASSKYSADNPDLIYAINSQLEILLEDQSSKKTYKKMMNEIDSIDNEVRKLESNTDNYQKIKECQYQYFNILKTYLPTLLKKESFFKSAFN